MSDPANGTRGQSPDDVRRLTPAPVFAAGDTVPNLSSWVLERKLGGGGFGEVWLARHAWNVKEAPRAVKFCTDPDARHRLVTHEKNVVLRVMKYAGDHPNVVPLLDCNLDGDVPWLMYEYVEGGTLATAIEEWRKLPLPQRLGKAVRTLHAIAGALARFHRFAPPLVHRDMKPQNVLMAGKAPRITDFGIGGVAIQPKAGGTTGGLTDYAARLPSALHAAGTRLYAPPEQMLGSTPNPRDDVYALGIIAYQMVMADLTAVPGADATLELRDLKVPSELVALIVKSVAMNAERRPKDASEWETALAAILHKSQKQPEPMDTPAIGSRAVLLPDPPPTERPPARTEAAPVREVDVELVEPPRKRRHESQWATGAVIFGAALFVGLTVWGISFLSRQDKQSEPTKPTERVEKPKGDPKVNAPGPKKGETPDPGPAKAPMPGETRDIEIAPEVKMTFCWVPAGERQLGSPKAERDVVLKAIAETNEPEWLQLEAEEQRRKFRTSGFWMGKYEVTQAEWAAVMRGTALATPSAFRVGGTSAANLGGITDTSRFPVENVSWDDCKQFLTRANAHGGIRKALGKVGEFGLPHEDAWEYACRGGLGNGQPFYFGNELNGTQANVDGELPFGTTAKGPYRKRPTPVGTYAAKSPHPWGLCDMHGNVWEWCENSYDKTNSRVLRGGSWYGFGRVCRAAYRNWNAPDLANYFIGFRLVVPGL